MDSFIVRMLKRSKVQQSQLPPTIAKNALLREKQLLGAYFAGSLQQREVAFCTESGAADMQPVFKVPTSRVPVRSPTKLNDRLRTRKENDHKENKSPTSDPRKPNVAVVAPRSSELLYPRRPPRSVYNSPLIQAGDEAPLIFEKRYKKKNLKGSPRRTSAKEDKAPLPVLNLEPNDVNDACGKVQNTEPKIYQNLYPSLPKINTSFPYDLEMALNSGSLSRTVTDQKMDTEPLELRKTPTKIRLDDVNIFTGGVKKMIEKFSQSPATNTSPNISPVRIPPNFEKLRSSPQASSTFEMMVEKFSQSPVINKSPNISPVRIPLKFDVLRSSPLASSTVNSPVKSPARPMLVVPKLYDTLEPSKPEFRDLNGYNSSPKADIGNEPASSELAKPPFEELEDKQLSISSYNVDNFLKDALGSELCFLSISSINAGTVYDGDSEMSVVSSESAPDIETSTLRGTDPDRFRSLRLENIQEKSRRPVWESSLPMQTSGGLPLSHHDRVKRLTMEASIQRSLVAQTSKALYLCRSTKQFKDSKELVEGERILLIANLRCQAAQEELKKCELAAANKPASMGSLTISDIFVPLKWNIFPKLDRNLCSQWFVCVLIMNETVQATEIVQLVDNQPILKFRGSMHLSDLSCDFSARLQLYAFRTPHLSPTRKSRIMQACKMLRRPARNCLGPAGSSEELLYFKSPAFTMIGCTELTVRLIGQEQPVSCSLQQVPMVSLIKGTINFRLSAQLTYTRQHSGFLNVLRPAGKGHAWQRWWCHLDGRILRFWNYPSEQEEKEAVFSINLISCLSDKAVPAPRVLCPRPRTLMLESQRSRGPGDLNSTLIACSTDSTIVRHFLACDCPAEMTEWSSAINECLEALRVWNIIPEMRAEKRI